MWRGWRGAADQFDSPLRNAFEPSTLSVQIAVVESIRDMQTTRLTSRNSPLSRRPLSTEWAALWCIPDLAHRRSRFRLIAKADIFHPTAVADTPLVSQVGGRSGSCRFIILKLTVGSHSVLSTAIAYFYHLLHCLKIAYGDVARIGEASIA